MGRDDQQGVLPARRRYLPALLVALAVLALPSVDASRASASVGLTLVSALDHRYGQFYGPGTTEAFSSPAVGDVTGDGSPDIVVGGMDGHVLVYSTVNGSVLLDFDTGPGSVQASPLLVDLNGDGVLDIVAANTESPAAQIWGITGSGGVLFHAAEVGPMPGVLTHGFFGTPAVGDIDGDGRPEIVASSWDHRIYAWSADTGQLKPGFPRFLYDTLWTGVVLADLDGDGRQEIVLGGDMDNYPGAPYPWGGMLWVLRGDASDFPGYPRNLPGETIWSTPAVVDLNGDGRLDIVFGTGMFFNTAQSRLVHALDALSGNELPGWPTTGDGDTGQSVAIGDLTGNGGLDVVEVTQGGAVDAWTASGQVLWRACARAGWAPCDGVTPTHGSAVIADVDNDGHQDVVVGIEGKVWVLDGASGAAKYSAPFDAGTYAPASTPTVAQVNGTTWIVHNTIEEASQPGARNAGDIQRVFIWRTGTPLGRAAWPTHKQNFARSGTIRDGTPPVASISPAIASTQSTTKVAVGWAATDDLSGVGRVQIDVAVDHGAWVRWIDAAAGGGLLSASGAADLYGLPNHAYDVRVRAFDRAGNASAWSATASTTINANATVVQPFVGMQVLGATGAVVPVASAPATSPSFGGDLARAIALRPDGSGYEADAWGGIHPFGGAPGIAGGGWWPGQDQVRGLALNPDGLSGYEVDSWGGLHPVGGAAPVTNGPYFPGHDVVRGLALLPSSTAAHPAGYVLDGWGAVHPFGSAPSATDGPYWPGFDIARSVAMNPMGPGGWVLDGWGALHPFGGAPAVSPSGYWAGWDMARGVAMFKDRGGQLRGYVVTGWGSLHAVNGAPTFAPATWWPGTNTARGVAVAPA